MNLKLICYTKLSIDEKNEVNKMHGKRRAIILAWSVVILWMALIFFLSHQPANKSSELSSGIGDVIVQMVDKVLTTDHINLDFMHFLIRKSAHFTAYFILGMLVIVAISKRRVVNRYTLLGALLICVIYAMTDEFHQLFIPGRSGEVRDVLIDSAGATVGIGIYLLLTRFFSRRQ